MLLLIGLLWAGLGFSVALEGPLNTAELERHLRYIASDELMGRMTGSPGAEKAAEYIEQRFREAGLHPLPGQDGLLQQVRLLQAAEQRPGTLRLGSQVYRIGEDLLMRGGPALKGQWAPVWVDDLGSASSQDVEGKVIFTPLVSSTGNVSLRAALREGVVKLKRAEELGAAGLIEVHEGPRAGQLIRFLSGQRRMELDKGAAPPSIPHVILGDQQAAPKKENSSSSTGGGDDETPPIQARLSEKIELNLPAAFPVAFTSSNVVGWIPGRDAKLRDEYVILTAHYDHIGAGIDKPFASEKDFIFNGARDNGMGVVALIGAAKLLAAQPPRRSVILLAVTGEEMGLLGSRAYVENPPAPLGKTIFVLNVDTGGYTDTDVVTVVGLERTDARAQLEQACTRNGLEAIQNPAPQQRLFFRSDNISFARLGVPALSFSPGFRAWTPELTRHYHRPSDEVGDDFDFEYLLRFTRSYAAAARLVADRDAPPHWVSGQPFQEAFEGLYGAESR